MFNQFKMFSSLSRWLNELDIWRQRIANFFFKSGLSMLTFVWQIELELDRDYSWISKWIFKRL